MNVHDKLFKATFSQAEHAAGIIRRSLPPEIVARIDFATLTLCVGSFVDESLKERHTDLLFSAKISGCTTFIYLLHEHQSRVEERMAFRLLRYMVRIWEAFEKDHAHPTLLPAIVAIVVHHNQTGWTAATELQSSWTSMPKRSRPWGITCRACASSWMTSAPRATKLCAGGP